MKVRDWMTADPQTVRADERLDAAREKMSKGSFRRLPVLDASGALVGIITDRDLRAHEGYLPSTRIDAVMAERPLVIAPEAPIEDAARVMIDRKIGALPVVTDEGRLAGIITETDLLKGFLHGFSGGEPQSARIDFEFTTPEQTFADAVLIVEAEGATVLGLGTLRPANSASVPRSFYLRVLSADPRGLADVLRGRGYAVSAVHTG